MDDRMEHHDDLGVTVVYSFHEKHTHHVDFLAVEIQGLPIDGGARDYRRKDGVSSVDTVENPCEAEPYARGSVKWDGCVNYEIGDQNDVMMHACGRGDLEKLSSVLVVIFERCGELMTERGVGVLAGEFSVVPDA